MQVICQTTLVLMTTKIQTLTRPVDNYLETETAAVQNARAHAHYTHVTHLTNVQVGKICKIILFREKK